MWIADIANQIVRIQSCKSQGYLQIANNNYEDKAPLSQGGYVGTVNQQWLLHYNDDKTFTLAVQHSQKILTIDKKTLIQDPPIIAGSRNSQRFKLNRNPSGEFTISPVTSHFDSIAVQEKSIVLNGTNPLSDEQKFIFRVIKRKFVALIGKEVWIASKKYPLLCLQLHGKNFVGKKPSLDESQRWVLQPRLDGATSIVNYQNEALTDTREKILKAWPIHDGENQKFIFQEKGDSYQINPKHNEKLALEMHEDGKLSLQPVRSDSSQIFCLIGTDEDKLLEPRIICDYFQRCVQWLKHQSGLDLSLLSFDWNSRCFCDICHKSRLEPDYYERGKDIKYRYVLPKGWVRISIPSGTLNVAAQSREGYDYHIAYHGTHIPYVGKILGSGSLGRRGGKVVTKMENKYQIITLAGIDGHIEESFDRINEYTNTLEKFNPNQFFVSPQIRYCSSEAYAKSESYSGLVEEKKKKVQCALEVAIFNKLYKRGQETMDYPPNWDSIIPNNELEWYWEDSVVGGFYLTGLLIKITDG